MEICGVGVIFEWIFRGGGQCFSPPSSNNQVKIIFSLFQINLKKQLTLWIQTIAG
jgi:hypothetical protein